MPLSIAAAGDSRCEFPNHRENRRQGNRNDHNSCLDEMNSRLRDDADIFDGSNALSLRLHVQHGQIAIAAANIDARSARLATLYTIGLVESMADCILLLFSSALCIRKFEREIGLAGAGVCVCVRAVNSMRTDACG